MPPWLDVLLIALAALAARDILQRRHAVLRNFPIIGHFRYWLEAVGPELRQYIVTSNDEERPFSRDQRRWVYASAKGTSNRFGFGTDNDLEQTPDYIIIRHAAFPHEGALAPAEHAGEPAARGAYLPGAKVFGAARGRRHAFRPQSVVAVSAMSFGSLSGHAVAALNRGCAAAGCLHNTGEGGISPYHLQGGELIWQIGTGYFGCRDERGRFDLEELLEAIAQHPVRALEIKLSQGAKPGHGGILPAAKITEEIARIRLIPRGRDCVSPPRHAAFGDVDAMLDFVERLAEATGLPVGIKSAVGELEFWRELATAMENGARGVDFITVDGGEGGTGAAPLVFSDHVALPFRRAFPRVYREFAERGVAQRVAFVGSGKLGFPERALTAFAMGCDGIAVAREALLAVGCIQSQRCHTDHCPTGVATQNRWLARGLDPDEKTPRVARYLSTLRREIAELTHACGRAHPAAVPAEAVELLEPGGGCRTLRDFCEYAPGVELPAAADLEAVQRLLAESPASRDPGSPPR